MSMSPPGDCASAEPSGRAPVGFRNNASFQPMAVPPRACRTKLDGDPAAVGRPGSPGEIGMSRHPLARARVRVAVAVLLLS